MVQYWKYQVETWSTKTVKKLNQSAKRIEEMATMEIPTEFWYLVTLSFKLSMNSPPKRQQDRTIPTKRQHHTSWTIKQKSKVDLTPLISHLELTLRNLGNMISYLDRLPHGGPFKFHPIWYLVLSRKFYLYQVKLEQTENDRLIMDEFCWRTLRTKFFRGWSIGEIITKVNRHWLSQRLNGDMASCVLLC